MPAQDINNTRDNNSNNMLTKVIIVSLLWAAVWAATISYQAVWSLDESMDKDVYEDFHRQRRLRDVVESRTSLPPFAPDQAAQPLRIIARDDTSIVPTKPRVWTQITFSAEYDHDLLPHTIRHYLSVGLDPQYFLITLHHPDHQAPELAQLTNLLKDFGIHHVQDWHGNFTSRSNCDMRVQHRQSVGVRDCDWVLKFDADEFLRVPGNDFPSFLTSVEEGDYDAVYATMVDRVSASGALRNISTYNPISEQFPLECAFSQSGNATTTKVVAFRGHLKEFRAGHGLVYGQDSCRYPSQLIIDHYKWSWQVFEKLEKRLEHYQWLENNGQGHHWWRESDTFLTHIYTNDNHIDIAAPEFQCAAVSGDLVDSKYLSAEDDVHCRRPSSPRCSSVVEQLHGNLHLSSST